MGYRLFQWGFWNGFSRSKWTSYRTGYQNTLDIVTRCSDSPIAASQALSYESEGYNDWFLPSKDELSYFYPNLTEVNFSTDYSYWSSTEDDEFNSFDFNFDNLQLGSGNKDFIYNYVRPIRAFGNWTMGCMDSLACNYNPEANMGDGSCEYAELGYDCEGNFTECSRNGSRRV